MLEPGSSYVHYNLGCELAKIQSNKQAMAHFSKVLALDPNHADAHKNMGIAYAEQDRKDEAIAEWETYLQLIPPNAQERAKVAGWIAQLKGQ